jgi:hypothetical protein
MSTCGRFPRTQDVSHLAYKQAVRLCRGGRGSKTEGLSRIERHSTVLRSFTARRQVGLRLAHIFEMRGSKRSQGIGIEGPPHAL